jgi:hypothetical protein
MPYLPIKTVSRPVKKDSTLYVNNSDKGVIAIKQQTKPTNLSILQR